MLRRRTSPLLGTLAHVTRLAESLEGTCIEVPSLTHWVNVVYHRGRPIALDAKRVALQVCSSECSPPCAPVSLILGPLGKWFGQGL